MGDLVDIPVLGWIRFTYCEINIIGEILRVFNVHSPVPMVVALEELFGAAVGGADLKDLLAVVDGMPLDGAEVESVLAGGDCDVGGGVVGAEDAVGYGVELVDAGADVGDGEGAVGGAVRPELIVLGIVLPGDGLGLEGEAAGAATALRECGVRRRCRGCGAGRWGAESGRWWRHCR